MTDDRRRQPPPDRAQDAILQKTAHVLRLDHDEIAREWADALSRRLLAAGRSVQEAGGFPPETLDDVSELIRGVAGVLLDPARYRGFLGEGPERQVARRLAQAQLERKSPLTEALVAYMRLRQVLIHASRDVFRESDQPFFELMARINRCMDRLLFAVAETYFEAFQRELERQALTDPLTELGNQRRFHDALRGELKRSDRTGRPFSVIFVDIDDFKDMNDRIGHVAADRVLVAVGDVVKKELRGSDLVCRWGGDEFIVILPETDRREAAVVAEKLRAAVQSSGACRGATVSIGIACCPEDGRDYDTLVTNADRALYISKQSGKNVVTASRGSVQRELQL